MGSKTHTSTPLDAEIWANIDRRLRTGDEDRWLSSRYAAPGDRQALVALYAYCWEVARVRLIVSEPTLGAIRFQWWRDALEEIACGEAPRAHDVVAALAAAVEDNRYGTDALLTILEGYEAAFEASDRSREPEALIARTAARALDPDFADLDAIDRAAPDFAALRRGETPAGSRPPLRFAAAVRPAVAHFRLRKLYERPKPASALARRLCVLKAVLTGIV